MSGVELIVGAVLGSVPIAIEVYDRYERVFQFFSAVKKYSREVSVLDARLGSQRILFRNNAINLLTAITRDQEGVHEVIRNPTSATPRLNLAMASVYRNRIDALDESFVSCTQTVEQIHDSLQVLCSQFDDLRTELGGSDDNIRPSKWLKHAKARFKLAPGKPKMKEAISDLDELNRDFTLITDQIVKRLQQISKESNESRLSMRRPAKSLKILQPYHRVRYASKALYATLQGRWNCSTHQYHFFDMQIIEYDHKKENGKTEVTRSRYVTCELAVTHDEIFSSSSKGPLHLEIQQACDSDDEELEQGKIASFSTDLSIIDDVCKRTYNSVACCNDRSFLGSWNGPHAEWFCVPAALPREIGESRAVSDIIKWIAEEPVLRSLRRRILVELAGNVAEGIMQFYSTPWLASGDLGQNVRYFGPDRSKSTPIQLQGPYFMTRFKNKQGKSLPQPQADASSSEGITLHRTVRFLEARNELLFNFGILMLEICYARPWHELKQAMTTTQGELSNCKTAEKLAGQLVNQLGLTYPKIIKKCLGCDFGLGETDMDNEDLQRRFLEDAVAGLQQSRDYMAEMNIAPLG
ncbi:hypothetical protein NW759_008007 [Fusarium solani]|nr:hypothetical protein NW759_008007 [Fusarium solani]